MKKALVITSVASMVDQFLTPSVFLLQQMGYEVHVACNFEQGSTCNTERIAELKQILSENNVPFFQIDFSRDIIKVRDHFRAYKQTFKTITSNNYDLVHCHSPIGGIITRLACRKIRKNGTKVFYTAHGFHFYKGASPKQWLLYYPVEKICAHFTDVLITINKEDYALAQKKMKAKRVEYVPGVGIDTKRFADCNMDCAEKRREIGIPEKAKLLMSVGELNKNKNHEIVIKALARINKPNVYYIIAGKGDLDKHLQNMINEFGLTQRVKLLGYRSDVAELYKIADVFVFPSFREGLSVSLMEAMTSGLPCIVSRIRGNMDLINENGGALFDPHSVENCKNAIQMLLDKDLQKIGEHNVYSIKFFDLDNVNEILGELYTKWA